MQVPEKFNYLEMNKDLQEALDSIMDSRENTVIIGNAGTGKSELIRIIQYLSHNDTIFLAPTGTAAVNIGGQTIHSFFSFPPTLITEADIQMKEKVALILNNIKRIVIDEIPMVRVDLFEAIDSSLKFYRGSNEPFGGIQMVVVGDLFQLPPIVKKDSEEDRYITDVWGGAYFFNSFAYKGAQWSKVELKKVYRQKDPMFTSVLNRIRRGYHTTSDIDYLNQKVMPFGKFIDSNLVENYIYLTAFNRIADKENQKRLSMLDGELFTFRAYYDKGTNGDMGFVLEVNGSKIEVELIRGPVVEVEKIEFSEFEYDYDKASKSIEKRKKGAFIQFPMKLAYAMTIHKAQGQTFEGGYINLGKAFAPHILYVAYSRFRDLEKIGIAKPIVDSDIKIEESAREFMATFSKRRERPLTKSME